MSENTRKPLGWMAILMAVLVWFISGIVASATGLKTRN